MVGYQLSGWRLFSIIWSFYLHPVLNSCDTCKPVQLYLSCWWSSFLELHLPCNTVIPRLSYWKHENWKEGLKYHYAIIVLLIYYIFMFFTLQCHWTSTAAFLFLFIYIANSIFCFLLSAIRRGGEKKSPNRKQTNKTKNFMGKILKGFIMSQYFQFTLHISLSPGGINTAY